MEQIVRNGPEPLRARLACIDASLTADRLKALIEYAQTGDGQRTDNARALIEAVQVAHDAARARECLASERPIPLRWLAALGGVSTARVRQLAREGVLRREGRRVALESARRWLDAVQPASAAGRVRAVTNRRLVAVEPSWWRNRSWSGMFYYEFGEVIRRLCPSGHVFGYDAGQRPYFEVLPGTMTGDELEEWRARIRESLEALDPDKGAWTSPSGSSMYLG